MLLFVQLGFKGSEHEQVQFNIDLIEQKATLQPKMKRVKRVMLS